MDVWVSECIRCKWVANHTTQDAAIKAAEDHVFTTHRGVAPFERAAQFIGHVQLRAANAIGFQEGPQADAGAAVSATPDGVPQGASGTAGGEPPTPAPAPDNSAPQS